MKLAAKKKKTRDEGFKKSESIRHWRRMENKNSNKYKVIVYSWNIGDSKRKEEIIACKERSINVIEKLKLVANASEFAFQDLSDFKQRPLKEKLIYAISKKNKAFKWPLIYIVESDDVYVCPGHLILYHELYI